MSQLLASLQADRFRTVMRNCASEHGLRFETLEDHFASMLLTSKSGDVRLVMFTPHDTTIEFMVTTDLEYDSLEAVPDVLSTHLLRANEKTRLGFWALTQIGDQYCYAVMYNIETKLLTPKLFASVLSDALSQVDDVHSSLRILTDSLA
ncbi:hypothetical protein IHN32_02270 [Deinococcus sp. 14RED07]|uniref:hypothetical protein n=1 Tax=Deinococcus sp. 14RED07 TaxID=2745874 RepID=UPI001E5AD9DC|nr:hypothetical protein [Deinococcus sp. 14RED07]MCD0174779.1 hypothetical protein [Deinococcus sp. 14RED07]